MPESSSDNSAHTKPNCYDEDGRIDFAGMNFGQVGAAYAIDAEKTAHEFKEKHAAEARLIRDVRCAGLYVTASRTRVNTEEAKGDRNNADCYEKLKEELASREKLLEEIKLWFGNIILKAVLVTQPLPSIGVIIFKKSRHLKWKSLPSVR
ncbi:hypothetical protein CSAL01_03241 [Colletotrichum salicis]|uniref:Uncharacterized protein n=1 Tax=Colletotrichum salicis TaxID=1209931 RepID=A0A135UYW6_9PEZI|nr:hypothetical protein CSAL01_03241 [Colletotrichum salicis]